MDLGSLSQWKTVLGEVEVVQGGGQVEVGVVAPIDNPLYTSYTAGIDKVQGEGMGEGAVQVDLSLAS